MSIAEVKNAKLYLRFLPDFYSGIYRLDPAKCIGRHWKSRPFLLKTQYTFYSDSGYFGRWRRFHFVTFKYIFWPHRQLPTQIFYNGPLVKTTFSKKCVNHDFPILTLSRSEPPLKAIRAEAAAAQRFSLDRAAMACYTSHREGAPAFRFDSAAPSSAPAQQASGALSRSAESGAKQAK